MTNKKLILMVFRLAPVENATTRRFRIKSPLNVAAPQEQYRQKKLRHTELLRLVYLVPARQRTFPT